MLVGGLATLMVEVAKGRYWCELKLIGYEKFNEICQVIRGAYYTACNGFPVPGTKVSV